MVSIGAGGHSLVRRVPVGVLRQITSIGVVAGNSAARRQKEYF